MSEQENHQTETTVSSENPSSDNIEKSKENQVIVSEQRSQVTSRVTMPQDIRYSIEEDDRTKLLEKYNNYEISDVNACNIRFLTDNRQKNNLFGQNDEEKSNMISFAKTFTVNIFPGYQHSNKHSYKVFGAEANIRKCLVEVMNRMYKRSKQHDRQTTTTTTEKSEETKTSTDSKPTVTSTNSSEIEVLESAQTLTTDVEKTVESFVEKEKNDNESLPHHSDTSVTGEEKPIIPSTPNTSEEPSDTTNESKNDSTKQKEMIFTPLERKPEFTFILLISSQGQEVLKKHWNIFAGPLQQRLNVIVTNPVKLPKFGDKQIQNELSIISESIENLTDASLQIVAFINDVLGVPVQPYQFEEVAINYDSYHEQSSASSPNNQTGRTFFSRNRNGAFEQMILIRSDCVPRIVGTRASNLKRIQTKCHLRDIIVGRQADPNGYIECTLSAYQIRNINFAINIIRNCLRNEDPSAVLVFDPNHENDNAQNSPHVHELVPPNTAQTPTESSQPIKKTGFSTKSLNFHPTQSYPQPSYNFQNTPSFDFTHQATSASRKTDKRRGELHDHIKTPNESQNSQYENFLSYSPRHKSKRTCPETKEIDCATDEGFWIQKQCYHALDDASKELFDSLIEKLDKIRIATEENVARKHQRLVGRNRCNKSKVHSSSIPYLSDANHNDLTLKTTQVENNIKIDQSTDTQEEKENKQETSNTIVVNQD
ncbi:hypothetical protein I4U23_026384 [Adineta vaga]|nr:hypothetical protein I4U23_026384 [Adineta vaga]